MTASRRGSIDLRGGRWRLRVSVEGSRRTLGYFDSEDEAERASVAWAAEIANGGIATDIGAHTKRCLTEAERREQVREVTRFYIRLDHGIEPVAPTGWRWLDDEDPCEVLADGWVYLLVRGDRVVYVGQTGDVWQRVAWHADSWKRFDRVRILPVYGGRRERTIVEQYILGIIGPTEYESGFSVRDQIEVSRRGPCPVDPEALTGAGPALAATSLLCWLLEAA